MTILILSGTREGRDIAQSVHDQGIDVISSLAGATRSPRAQSVPTRIGGFGGAQGFERFLKEKAISAVLDATHPFAASISRRSAEICAKLALPYCLYLRPAWQPSAEDSWTMLQSETDAALHIEDKATVFLATGRQTLHRFENLSSCHLICRQIDPPDGPFPFPNGDFLIGRPPFTIEDEKALFQRLKVDWLVVKNAGGSASFSKLEAARQLGLSVAMIKRPKAPDALTVSTVKDAITWAVDHG